MRYNECNEGTVVCSRAVGAVSEKQFDPRRRSPRLYMRIVKEVDILKYGVRKPNYLARIKARTTGKVTRELKRAVNPLYGKRGVGFVTNPERSIKNAVYHRTTVGVPDVISFASSANGRQQPAQPRSPYTQPVGNPYANPAPKYGRSGRYAQPTRSRKPKRKIPIWVWIIVGVLVVAFFANLFAPRSNAGITKLSLHYTVDDRYTLQVGESVEDYLTVYGKDDFPIDSIAFISSNPSVAAFSFVNTADENVYFRIDAVSPGNATLYAQTTDGVIKSDEIAVSVEVAPTPTPAPTPEPTAEPTPEPTQTPEPTETPDPMARTVWISDTGSKYHSNSSCGTMSSGQPITLGEAIDMVYEPCERCY